VTLKKEDGGVQGNKMINVDKEELREYINNILEEGDEDVLTEQELESGVRCLVDAAHEFGMDAIWDMLEDVRD